MAKEDHMARQSNPYRPGTDEYHDWLAGFEDFADDDDFIDID